MHNLESELLDLKSENECLRQHQINVEAQVQKNTQEVLAEQLREMSCVLEEFDEKYTKKEKQVDSLKSQVQELKEDREKLQDLYSQTSNTLHAKQCENERLQQDTTLELSQIQ